MRVVLLSNETSTAPFPRCLQNIQPSFRSEGDAGVKVISAKIETYRVTKVKICLVRYEDYEEIFFLPPDVGVKVLVC